MASPSKHKPTLEEVKLIVQKTQEIVDLAKSLDIEILPDRMMYGKQSWITVRATVDGIQAEKTVTVRSVDTF